MRQGLLGFALFGLLGILLVGACGTSTTCEPGAVQACLCDGNRPSIQTCNADGKGFSTCACATEVQSEKAPADGGTEPPRESTTPDAADAGDLTEQPSEPEPIVEAAPEPEPMTEPEPTTEPEPATEPEPMTEPEPIVEVAPEPVVCTSEEFKVQEQCHKVSDFCQGKIQQAGFPAFSQNDIDAMAQPFVIEFDSSGRPLFCQSKVGFYYLRGTGYGACDKDKDGWINIEAYRAVTSTDPQIQSNARCTLRKFEHIVYHAEGQRTQLQKLDNPAAMVETFRNDGGTKLIERPVYTKDQKPLPKSQGSACSADTDCTNQVCYLGQCLDGRRFEPAEVNTLTKGCIAGLDLNDNKLDDANEGPSDSPDPASEFKPLLAAAYFIELHHGHFQSDYDNNGTKIPVYHIYERSRALATDKQGLALNCQQDPNGFRPDYWKTCKLKDNQQCQDPNDPTQTKPGLTYCWLKESQRLIPSLFKCATFDNTQNKDQDDGYFHPDNYGLTNKYNRTICNVKSKLNENDPTRRDLAFECTVDDGNRKPDPTAKEVGWACVNFRSYAQSGVYLGGCIDELAEKVCGETKDGNKVTYVTNEAGSYGMVRAYAPCGQSTGQGECSKAWRVCTGGTWLDCDKCDNCPQDTAGQKATCPNGTWPVGSCKRSSTPSAETCNSLDDDCDGSVDEGLTTVAYYTDKDKDGFGDKNATAQRVCSALKPTGTVANNRDCDDDKSGINPNARDVCDGVDNDCDGSVDEGNTFRNYYKDEDNDGYGQKGSTRVFRACVMVNNNNKVCKGKGDCVDLNYTTATSIPSRYRTNSNDCCDQDKTTHPGAVPSTNGGFPTSQNACGSWDYNCDGKITKDTRLRYCACSKTVDAVKTTGATCRVSPKNSSTCNWIWDSAKTVTERVTSTNGTNLCQLDYIHEYKVTGGFSQTCEKRCSSGIGKGSYTLSCGARTFATWSPKATDGTTSLFPIPKAQFGSGTNTCHFMLDGTIPDCGETTSTIANNVADGTPSHTTNAKVCGGSSKKCSVTWNADCSYVFTVNYDDKNYYFKTTSIRAGTRVGCR